jgi:MFS transporter, DHA1 family, inner membrane transport protein
VVRDDAVMPDLQREWRLPGESVGTLTSVVQLGFVGGTLVFALVMLADRHRPQLVFLTCALAGAVLNALTLAVHGSYPALLLLRFGMGFLLAGVYPVGMKIAASWYRQRLGAVMGVLIGALVLGTALPHGLRAIASADTGGVAGWRAVVLDVSALAAMGGFATAWLVPVNPDAPGGTRITPRALTLIWSDRRLRASVFGYFGHMWELYAFYVLVPLVVATRVESGAASALAFWIIAAGFAGCVAGGLLVRRFGSASVANFHLTVSTACCVAAPLVLAAPLPLFIAWLLLWGTTVVGDSPQFSTLTAQNAPPAVVGSVLTFTNCIGFAISVVSIELFVRAAHAWPLGEVLPWLAIGPVLGLWMLRPLLRGQPAAAARPVDPRSGG